MVKVFPGEKHGFAHQTPPEPPTPTTEQPPHPDDEFLKEEFGGLPTNSMDGSSAEVAYLLSTAWIETYSRVYLPTIGQPVADTNDVWSSDLQMQDLTYSNNRDVRAEIEEQIANQPDVKPDFRRMHPDDFKTPMDDLESMEYDDEEEMENSNVRDKTKPYGIDIEDDVHTVLEKMMEAADRGELEYTPGVGDIPLDESEEGYWQRRRRENVRVVLCMVLIGPQFGVWIVVGRSLFILVMEPAL